MPQDDHVELVISRRQGQAVKIGDNITLTVLDVSGSQVTIGIDGPLRIALGEEVLLRIAGEGKPAP